MAATHTVASNDQSSPRGTCQIDPLPARRLRLSDISRLGEGAQGIRSSRGDARQNKVERAPGGFEHGSCSDAQGGAALIAQSNWSCLTRGCSRTRPIWRLRGGAERGGRRSCWCVMDRGRAYGPQVGSARSVDGSTLVSSLDKGQFFQILHFCMFWQAR